MMAETNYDLQGKLSRKLFKSLVKSNRPFQTHISGSFLHEFHMVPRVTLGPQDHPKPVMLKDHGVHRELCSGHPGKMQAKTNLR